MSEENLPPEDGDEGYVAVPAEDIGEGDDTQAENSQEDPPTDDTPSFEDIASEMGWSPQDKWKGDPDKWKPAHEFVRSTAEINSKLSNRLKSVEDTLGNINRTNAAMMERALAKQREELLAKRKEAFDNADYDAMTQVDRELSSLPQTAQTPSPEAQDFVQRNAHWWGKDQEASAWAQQRAGQLAEQGLSPARQLAVVERELATYFPEYAPKAEKPKPRPAPLTEPGNRGGSKRAKGFADLPKEAQKEALYWEGKGIAREDFAKTYFSEEGQQ